LISVESQSCRRVVQTGESVVPVQQYPEGTRVGKVVEFRVRTVVWYVAQDMTVTPHIYHVPGTVAVPGTIGTYGTFTIGHTGTYRYRTVG
jgi:hypothetical protein